MEWILCGVTERAEEMVRYITMCESAISILHVEEILYQIGRVTVCFCTEREVYESAEKKQETKRVLKVVQPPGKTQIGKAIGRICTRAEVIDGENIDDLLEIIGCKRIGRREYTKRVYGYRGAKIVIISKEEKEIVFMCIENSTGVEAQIEDIKNRLSMWIDLVTPPQEVWSIIVGSN